jgi:diaminopimelate decarboxylase
MVYDVVGPVCETADIFARDRELPQIGPDDLLVIMTAGAYGAAMSSAYNARPPAPEVLVTEGHWSVVKPRLSHEALIALERTPSWLA